MQLIGTLVYEPNAKLSDSKHDEKIFEMHEFRNLFDKNRTQK